MPELLSYTNFMKIIRSNRPIEQSLILTQHLKSDTIISRDCLYLLKDNLIYEAVNSKKIDETITLMISKYINASFNAFSKDDLADLYCDENKGKRESINNIFTNNAIKSMLPQIKGDLTENNIKFDTYEHKIHFLNGYLDLKTNTFRNRELTVDFISKCINREYNPSSLAQQESIMKHLRKIYPIEEDRNVILLILGRALAGMTPDAQKMTFLLGNGSSGKSTVMKLCKEAFTCYYKELGEDTFSNNLSESKRSKVMNTFKHEPQIRFTCVNEMEDKCINKSMFKLFPEGEVQTVELYQSGSDSVYHRSGLFLPCNTMPNIDWDSGSRRRAEAFEQKSLFICDSNKKHLINEKKHIYEGNSNLIADIVAMNLLDAWCDILFVRSYNLLNKKQVITYTKSFTEIKNLVVDCDNKFKDFVDTMLFLEETDESVRIHKDEMLERYKEFSENHRITNRQLIPKLKEYSVKYGDQLRVLGYPIKGAYYCVRWKVKDDKQVVDEEDDDEEKVVKNDEECTSIVVVDTLQEENAKLKEEIEKLKKLLAQRETISETASDDASDEDASEVVIFENISIDEVEDQEPDRDDLLRDYTVDELEDDIFSQLL